MATDQPVIAGNVIAFTARFRPAVYLTAFDRIELPHWHVPASVAGYDRIVIHERELGDDSDIGDFLCLYRRGEAWSRWGLARKGAVINVWCCLTGADIGDFPDIAGAFEAVLGCTPLSRRAEPRRAVVTDLMPRLRQAANRLGSAA